MKHVGSTARGRSSGRFCLLVTGFGAFPGARKNPTIEILQRLQRSRARLARLDIELRCAVVPVVYAEIGGTLHKLFAEHRPDAVLHLGLAARRTAVCVETRATNRAGPMHCDASGRRPAAQILVAGAPPSLTASFPAALVLAAILRGGIVARRSIDAGDYVCNATLYRTLLAGAVSQVGFLHVPRPHQACQLVKRTRVVRPRIEALTEAALAAILVMARRYGSARAVRDLDTFWISRPAPPAPDRSHE